MCEPVVHPDELERIALREAGRARAEQRGVKNCPSCPDSGPCEFCSPEPPGCLLPLGDYLAGSLHFRRGPDGFIAVGGGLSFKVAPSAARPVAHRWLLEVRTCGGEWPIPGEAVISTATARSRRAVCSIAAVLAGMQAEAGTGAAPPHDQMSEAGRRAAQAQLGPSADDSSDAPSYRA